MKLEAIRLKNFRAFKDAEIKRIADDPQVAAYVHEGDQLGYLWKQGFFPEAVG